MVRHKHLTILVLFLASLTLSCFNVWHVAPAFAQSETCDLEYFVDVRTPQSHTAFVSMTISLQGNIASFDLSIYDWRHYKDQHVQIFYIASKKENLSLPFDKLSNSSWKVYPMGYMELVVKYATTLQVPSFDRLSYISYLGSEFGVAYEHDVLLIPSLSVHSVKMTFGLPSGWALASPYELQSDGSYSPAAIGLWNCIIGFGPFRVDNYVPGSYQLSVASYGETRYAPEKYGESIRKFVRYFTCFSDGFWSKKLVVIVAAQSMMVGGLAWGPTLFINGAVDWRILAHELVHVWNAAHGFAESSWWDEGVAEYYAGLALVNASIWSESNYSSWLINDPYQTYTGYLGTKYDRALSELWRAYENSRDQGYLRNMYAKGALFAFLLDRTVQHITVNRSLSDVVKYLNTHFSRDLYTNTDLLRAICSVTAEGSGIELAFCQNNFVEFFNNYVYGNKKLPLLIRGGTLDVDWPEVLYPHAMIISSTSYLDLFGYCNIVGEVQNTGVVALIFVNVTATFYDVNGIVIGTSSGFTYIYVLEPGHKSPFLILLDDVSQSAKVHHYSLSLSFNRASSKPLCLKILSDSSYIASNRRLHVVGEIKNTGSQVAQDVWVVATFYGGDGKVIGVAINYSDPKDIPPGEKAPFDVSLSSDRTPLSKSYALEAQSNEYNLIPEFQNPLLIFILSLIITVLATRKHNA